MYSGNEGRRIYLDKLILTNQRIICAKYGRGHVFEIPLSHIEKYGSKSNVPCVDHYIDKALGDCLRIQTTEGTELFAIKKEKKSQGVLEELKSLINGTVNENKTIDTWVSKIIEEFADEYYQERMIGDEHIETVHYEKVEEVILCPECGNKCSPTSKFCPKCGASMVKTKVIEIIKCRKCGAKIDPNVKFCPSCGTLVIESPDETEKKQPQNTHKEEPPVVPSPKKEPTREERVEKCIYCGEILPSDAFVCPSCGHEVRGRKAVTSAKELMDKLSHLDSESERIETIKSFVVPNDKEDIMEMMILATSNFDHDLYYSKSFGENVATAWMRVIEQCYTKATIFISDEKDLAKIKKMYKKVKKKTIKTIKLKYVLVISAAVILVTGIVLCFVFPIPKSVEETTTPYYVIGPLTILAGALLLVFSLVKGSKLTDTQAESNKEKQNR